MLPAVMKYNINHGSSNPEIVRRQTNTQKILRSDIIVIKLLSAVGLQEYNIDLGDTLDAIIRALGLPRTLTELGVSKHVIPTLSKRALDDFWAPTNPVPLLNSEQVQEILEAVI